jgi:hypothetical protein
MVKIISQPETIARLGENAGRQHQISALLQRIKTVTDQLALIAAARAR